VLVLVNNDRWCWRWCWRVDANVSVDDENNDDDDNDDERRKEDAGIER